MSDELKFRVSSGLKNIIGRDLITDEYIAVFELVKNSFDAHATEVEISFENIFTPDGKIIITDNGKGMNYDDLLNKWLFVAYSAKRDGTEDIDYRDKINNRFYYAGAKGIGRFSCDKLGTKLRLISTKDEVNSKTEEIDVDWTKFEENTKDEFVNISVDHRTLDANPSKFEFGTMLEITALRADANWNADKILKLKHSLAKLINPFESANNRKFNINIKAPEFRRFDSTQENSFRKINGRVKNNLLEILKNKTVKIQTEISSDGDLITTELIDNGQLLYRITERNTEFLLLKDILIELYHVNRKAKNNFTRLMGVRSRDYGSVFLYKNNIRIYPFGEPGEDAWGLDIRQQKRVGDYVGTSELIGRIEISGDNDEFAETTSRGDGLIKNESYAQLKNFFIYDVIPKLENYVVKFLKYGIDIKKYDNTQNGQEGIVRYISGISNDNIVSLEFNPNLLDLIGYNQTKSNSAVNIINSIESIAKEYKNDDLLSMVEKVKSTLEDAIITAEIAEEDIREKEKLISAQTTQNLFLKSLKSQDFDEIVSFMHHIGIAASNIENEVGSAYQTLVRKGEINIDELKNIFQLVSLEMRKILSITRFATKANFKLFADETEMDLIKYIQEYIVNIIKPMRNENLNIHFTETSNSSFISVFRPLEISIIVDNLVSNSYKAKAKNIEIDLKPIDNELLIYFKDDGQGVDSKVSKSLFDIGITTTPGGSGLGLYHLKKMIEDMGGTINLVNNKPATFIIKLKR